MGKAKTLNNVVINMTLKPTQTRAKLSTSSEDLAVQMGKINKWYDSLVPTGGASGNILEWDSDGVAKWVTPSFLDEKVKSTLLAQSTAEGSYRPTFVTGAGTGGVNIIDSFKVNHTPGTTSAVGNTRLILGNATASGTANNEEGQLKLYSSGTSFHTLKGTTVSSEVIHVLPSTGGTILNDRTTTYTQTVASSVTGAYEIGKIKINGTTTTIYGKDTNTTYTASDGIKIESNVIKHTNSIATAASVFKKISYDAQGHITGTANVTKSDIPALDYIVKPGQVGSASRPIYINNSSVPTQCDTPSSGAYWAGVPYVGSNGVMEIGKYIDFHGTNASTNDYDYRITAETQILYFAPKSSGDATYNLIRMQSPDYNQIQFQTTKSGKAYTSTGIVAYPLTTSGQTMLIQSDGNTVVGGGESPRTLYSNSYDNMDTAENETLYLASDSSEIHFITNCQAYSGRKVLKVQDGQLVKSGGQWIWARDTAPVYANKPNTQDGGYYPAWFAKTKSGGWSMGVLSAQDNLYITYTTDTDYSGGSNVNTYQVQFQNKSGTVALTSDLAGYVPMETVTTDTSADNYFTKTEWVNWNKNAGTSTTNLPTANWGILITKSLPSVQMWIPDNASGIYFRRKADASTAATAWWGITGTAGNTYNLANISNTGFGYRTLNATTVNTTAGSFVFGGDALLGGVNDWAGIQVEGINDRFQLLINGHLMVRQNDDATISAAGWTAWTSCLRPADVSGSSGITVTQNDVTIGSGSTAATYKGTVTISHSNSITASTSTVFRKFSYDANGHITGTAAVAASDIPALNYVPNTQAGVNAAINLLSTGTSTPTDADYYISQYVGGGTTTTTYHRRPMSALWSYVKGKADSIYAPLSHTHAYTVPVGITIKTGSSDQSHITLQTLMAWLITTKGYITSNTARALTLYTSWSYAGNDILQLTIDGTAYELQLAGVIIEFDGYASDYQTGTFRLRIHSSPTVSFTPASGYTQFPASHIAEYTCNGSSYSPTWKMLVDSGDTVTRTGGGASGTWGISISGSAAKLGTANKGSTTKGIYLSGGTPQEMTYSLNSTVNSGTANCIAYYSGANAISSAAKVTYVNANNSASTPATVAGLHIESPTYGNTAANMLGGVAGLFSYGDGGPQIRFKDASSTQAGALIFTADDTAATGTSWHFVSNESDWNVISKRFHAKTSISIGTDKPSTSYNLTVTGTSYFTNTITIKGTSSGNASINYASYGNTRNYTSIKFYDGNASGQGVQVGGGGLTVLGGGESAQAVFDNLSTLGWNAADEVAIVASDGPIYFMTNCDTFANRKSIGIDTSGYLNTGYINMNISDQDNQFSTASSIIYSNSDKYLRRVSLTTLGSTLGPYVGPYVTNVSDGSVIHQNNYNSAGGSRPVHRFIRSLRTNKLAFTLPANITMEYSTNAGSSWASFGYTDAQKAGPFISRHYGGSIAIGPASGERTTSMQTRITITNDGRDCMIDQFYIWMSTSGHDTTVDIQYTTQSAKTTWVDWRTGVGLAGWAGPNVINVSELRYGNTIYSIRFIFKITSVRADYKTQPGTIYDIQAYGAMACWTSKNNMMMHDSLYTWNHDQVATFPAEIRVPIQLRVYGGNYGTIFRSDGTNTYLLVTDSGSAEIGSWNSLRPFYFNNSTGYVTMGNGAQVISASYGALSVIRSGSTNSAGIKFYNNTSAYLGSLALGTANGTFVRFKTDEATSYEIIDRSVVTPTPSSTVTTNWNTASERTIVVTKGWMSYWNGAYNGSSSNLAYCNKGAFGTIVTHAAGDYVLKAGDTMNANTSITIPYGTGNIIYDGGTGLSVHAPTNSGWARGIDYYVGSTWYGGFGANGGGGTFDSLYIGKYSDKTVQIDPINKITTFNGVVNLMANQYDIGATTKTALNCNNSNITGINSLIFNDASENAGEGIMFYRSATPSWDVIWAKDGLLHFTPNYPTSSDDLSIGFTLTSSTTDAWSSIGVGLYNTERYQLKVIRTDGGNTYPSWMGWNYSPAIAFGGADTKGVISMHYSEPGVMFIGGQNDSNHTKPNWNFGISGTSGTIYNLNLLPQRTLTVTTLNNQTGSFAFSGGSQSGEIWAGTDWVGIQIGSSDDKFQLTVNSGNLLVRQNDYGGTDSTHWGDWQTLAFTTSTVAKSKVLYSYNPDDSSTEPSTSLYEGLTLAYYQTSKDYYWTGGAINNGNNHWAHYITMKHNDNYHCIMRFPFWHPPQYLRKESSSVQGWYNFVTDEDFSAFRGWRERCYAWTNTGWYRVMEIPAQGTSTSGRLISDITLHIKRQFNNQGPESIGIRILFNYEDGTSTGGGDPKIEFLYSHKLNSCITQVRLSKSSDGKKVYVELYYDSSTKKNAVSIRYEVLRPIPMSADPNYFPKSWLPAGNNYTEAVMVPISDTPIGILALNIPDHTSQMNCRNANGYYGLANPAGSDYEWLRSSSLGLIPYESGAATSGGHSNLGTSSWYFKEAYVGKVVANTIDCEGLTPRHTNEINFKSPGSTLWFGYRIITDDKGSGTTSPSTPISTYLFGCGKGGAQYASIRSCTAQLQTTGGSYYAELTGGSLTYTRTIHAPDAGGTMSVSKLVFTSTGTTTGSIDVPTGARYLVVEVLIAATSVKSFHKVAIDTSYTSTSLIQTTTKGQYGLQLTLQPIQFTLTNATSITGGTRYTLTLSSGSVMSISAGTTPTAASASPQITKVYAQA